MPYQRCFPPSPLHSGGNSLLERVRPWQTACGADASLYVGSLGNHRWLSLSVIINGLSPRHRNVFPTHRQNFLLPPTKRASGATEHTPSFNPITTSLSVEIQSIQTTPPLCHTNNGRKCQCQTLFFVRLISQTRYCPHIS